MWNSSVGSYWDATLALADVDGDGVDDVLVNANTSKCCVASGRNGRKLVESTVLPAYRDLGVVDYNGAIVVVGTKGRELLVVNAEDDAHLALLAVPMRPRRGARTRILWAAPQEGVDDERHSMAALAPAGLRRVARRRRKQARGRACPAGLGWGVDVGCRPEGRSSSRRSPT